MTVRELRRALNELDQDRDIEVSVQDADRMLVSHRGPVTHIFEPKEGSTVTLRSQKASAT